MAETENKRFWRRTIDKLELISGQTGMTRVLQVDACVRGFLRLDRDRRDRAIANSDTEPTEGVPVGLWPGTVAMLEELHRTTGIQTATKLLDVVVAGWWLLTREERDAVTREAASAKEAA